MSPPSDDATHPSKGGKPAAKYATSKNETASGGEKKKKLFNNTYGKKWLKKVT
jgi:hypothetical protein